MYSCLTVIVADRLWERGTAARDGRGERDGGRLLALLRRRV